MHLAAAISPARLLRTALSVFFAASLGTATAAGRGADTVLVNGKVVVYDAAPAQALAVRDGRIVAIGRSAAVRALAGPQSRVIDLGGRTVIPGLIDSHIHAIRAGLGYATEVNWFGARTLGEALARLSARAKQVPRGSWLIVAGGWSERQFREDRLPTPAEIAAAAPEHFVYVQWFYGKVLLSPGGDRALGLPGSPLATRLVTERDAAGHPTGWLAGDARTISDVYDLLPRPTHAEQLAGTRTFFLELNTMGITGIVDPGGYNMALPDYRALFELWRARELTVRVRYSLSAPRRDRELEDFQSITALLPTGYGDEWLRFNGIGENVTWGFYNNDQPDEAHKAQLDAVLRWAVERGQTATFHWHNDRAVHHLLDALERVNAALPIARLRWSIAHLNDASPDTLRRMRALGVGWLAQNAFYFRGEAFLGQRGPDAASRAPALVSARRMGIPVGAGTDAHRVMTPNPFIALQWMLDGRTVSGTPMRAPGEQPSRMEALRLYTEGSAWFSFEENERGTLAPGRWADLAVLDRDYLGVPVSAIGETRSLLTMVGGRIVHAAKPFALRETRR